jgi:hypothetical protein
MSTMKSDGKVHGSEIDEVRHVLSELFPGTVVYIEFDCEIMEKVLVIRYPDAEKEERLSLWGSVGDIATRINKSVERYRALYVEHWEVHTDRDYDE